MTDREGVDVEEAYQLQVRCERDKRALATFMEMSHGSWFAWKQTDKNAVRVTNEHITMKCTECGYYLNVSTDSLDAALTALAEHKSRTIGLGTLRVGMEAQGGFRPR